MHGPGKVAWLLAYPDTYEIGLPNQGLQILYELLNEREDAVAERTYAPWLDMEAAMRAAEVPLFSVDQHLPASAFDVLAFNLSAELVYTNVLNMIDLAGFPLRADQRDGRDPLVLAGGHCAFNPEPLSDFVDRVPSSETARRWSARSPRRSTPGWTRIPSGGERVDLRHRLAGVPGVYVPALYEARYVGGRLAAVRPGAPGVPEQIEKRTVADLGEWPYPRHQLVPVTEVVHDRLNVEVFRGLHEGLPFLPGRHDHPSGARATATAGARHGEGRAGAHRVRRGSRAPPSRPPTSPGSKRRCGR